MSNTTKEEYQHQLERANKEIASLKKQKTGWMVAAIILLILFAITLALKLS
ncbi:hypothetical protein IM774_08325 [Erysipelotrichaceae bacterium RD49]|nr:hypothetical protein [Erysipelotrichaceae bacterium RD49]